MKGMRCFEVRKGYDWVVSRRANARGRQMDPLARSLSENAFRTPTGSSPDAPSGVCSRPPPRKRRDFFGAPPLSRLGFAQGPKAP